jgi:hypothetical protein
MCGQETLKWRPKVRPGLQAPVNEWIILNNLSAINWFNILSDFKH